MKVNLTQLKNKRVHFIGVGGVSMSALALYVIKAGYTVSGSDISANDFTLSLENLGAKIYYGHLAENVENADVIVYSSAIDKANPELLRAKELGVKIYERSAFLSLLLKRYDNVIGISGCHGKTTVTAMLTHIFVTAKKQVTSFIGGQDAVYGNFLHGDSNEFCICEACEFKKNFLRLNPTLAVVTNVDSDHLDTYPSLEEIKKAYQEFATGKVTLYNADDVNSRYLFSGACFTFGIQENAQIRGVNLKCDAGYYSFSVSEYGVKRVRIRLKIQGLHNVYNSLTAIAVARYYGVNYRYIKKALENFTGVKRRGETLAVINGVKYVADYAHHPSEIMATLKGVDKNETAIVFQPHTFSRTKALKKEFVNALKEFDVAIYKTFPARENFDAEGSAYSLYGELKKENFSTEYLPDERTLTVYLNGKSKTKKQILFLGAGDLYSVAQKYLSKKYKT